MSASEITKRHIATTLKEMVRQQGFSSLSVGELIRRCDISRNTFYYHFRDKYEVVSWIFYDEVRPFLAQFDRLENWTAGLSELCLYLQASREFYIPMLEVEGQNSFCECLTHFYQDLIYALLLKQGGACAAGATDANRFPLYCCGNCERNPPLGTPGHEK